MIASSAALAAWQAVEKILDPRPMTNVGWVIAAGVVGFAGDEAVALYRIRVGQRIGSAALVADGVHARTDGFTSSGRGGRGRGAARFPLADPIVGLLIAVAIVVLLAGTVRAVGRRLMDRVEHALGHVEEVTAVELVRLRWIGHRLHGDAVVRTGDVTLAEANRIAAAAETAVKQHVPKVDEITVHALAPEPGRTPA